MITDETVDFICNDTIYYNKLKKIIIEVVNEDRHIGRGLSKLLAKVWW